MKKPVLWLLCGMAAGSVATAPIVAGAESLQVAISNVKLMMNGVDKTPAGGSFWNGIAQVPAALEYQGTTYVPVRYVSEALGYPVEWEGTTRTVFIGSKPVVGSAPALPIGQSARPEQNVPVTFTPLNSVLYDTGDTNLVKVSVAVRNDDTKPFSFGAYQSSFTHRDGTQYTGTLYVPQGSDYQIDPKTTRVLQYYTTVPKGVAESDLTFQLTKVDFSTYPAKIKPWATVPLQSSAANGTSYMGYDTPTFDLVPYQVQLGSISSWSYDYKAYTQVYKLHVKTSKTDNVNAFPNATELIFEVVDGNGQSVAQTRYAVGTSTNAAVPVLGDGDQYITFNNLTWSRYSSSGTKIQVYEAFQQGKRLLGAFSIN
ncbi:stalk domain-containing protein [Effusibacillus consociatus]|uniref:Stalk domain-containing protein n=1 Tax=Effusibacillus consociatus TaxID=1117041 RepID=A0ABV9Q2L7_9BACL